MDHSFKLLLKDCWIHLIARWTEVLKLLSQKSIITNWKMKLSLDAHWLCKCVSVKRTRYTVCTLKSSATCKWVMVFAFHQRLLESFSVSHHGRQPENFAHIGVRTEMEMICWRRRCVEVHEHEERIGLLVDVVVVLPKALLVGQRLEKLSTAWTA